MSHNAPARFFTRLGFSPRLQQTTYATTRKLARVCGRSISPLAYCRTPRRELHPSYRTIRDMFSCSLTTNCFPAFAPQLSSFRSLSGISMLGFYIAFNNRPFGLVTNGIFSFTTRHHSFVTSYTDRSLINAFIPFIGIKECLELSVRFELTTFRLQGECSAVEL